MNFPKELKKSIESCILSLIFPREDIISFFKSCGCNNKDLNTVKRVKNITRAKIIYLMFARISDKPDNGYIIFKAMNNKLINWNKFDEYYFDKINKLDREEAEKALEEHKSLQDLLDN